MKEAVTYRRDGAIGVVELNRSANRNSMTSELLDAFAAASEAARVDAKARCVVITGSGSTFSAGADFKAQIQRGEGTLPHERSYAIYEPFLSVLDIEVPVIAAMNGHAVGGGFGLALMCDIRIAARGGAKYGANFCRLGLAPGMAISYLLPRLVGASKASEMLYTGRLIEGAEMAEIGLASRALEPADVFPAALELAKEIAGSAPLAVKATKRAMMEGLGWDARKAAYRESYAQAATVDTEDAREGIAALLEKRAPRFAGR